jgi:hypothetical protein
MSTATLRNDNTGKVKNDNGDEDEFTSKINKLSISVKENSDSNPKTENVTELTSSSVLNPTSSPSELKSLHISCFSDSYDSFTNYIGLIFYDNWTVNGYNIHPGYIVLKNCYALR